MAYDGTAWPAKKPLQPWEKLRVLADFVESVPPHQLVMNCWGYVLGGEFRGCMMGWAGYARSEEMGFSYDPYTGDFSQGGRVMSGMGAATTTFNINWLEALLTFGILPSDAGAQLRRLADKVERRNRPFFSAARWGWAKLPVVA